MRVRVRVKTRVTVRVRVRVRVRGIGRLRDIGRDIGRIRRRRVGSRDGLGVTG